MNAPNEAPQQTEPQPPPRAIAVLYHGADWDGIASGLVIKWWMSQANRYADVQMFPMNYGDPLPKLDEAQDELPTVTEATWYTRFENIFIVDFSCPQLIENPAARDRLVWIDHHRSAIEKYESLGLEGARVDGVAACRLAWQWGVRKYVTRPEELQTPFPDVARFRETELLNEPATLRLIGLWDVWDHSDPRAVWFQYGLDARPYDDASRILWYSLMLDREKQRDLESLEEILRDGRAVQRYFGQYDKKRAAELCHTFTWHNLRFCCRQMDRNSSMGFYQAVKQEHDALMAWHLKGNGQVEISLYRVEHKPEVDILSIATAAGGGGHPGECGFRMGWYEFSQFLESVMRLERGETL